MSGNHHTEADREGSQVPHCREAASEEEACKLVIERAYQDICRLPLFVFRATFTFRTAPVLPQTWSESTLVVVRIVSTFHLADMCGAETLCILCH